MRRSAAPARSTVPAPSAAPLDPRSAPDWRRSGLAVLSWALAVAGILVALGIAAGSAHAEPAPEGVEPLAVRTTGDGAPAIVVTNTGDASCRVASTTLGTVTVVRAAVDGRPAPSSTAPVAFEESVDRTVHAGLQRLEPGRSVELALRVVPVGPTGRSLQTVSWAPVAASIATFHELAPDGRLDLEVRYEVPPLTVADPTTGTGTGTGTDADADVALCPAARASTFPTEGAPDREALATTAAGDAGGADGRGLAVAATTTPTWKRVGVLVAAVVILVAVVAIALILAATRRRRRATTAALAVLAAVGASLIGGVTAPPAEARIRVDPGFGGDWATCEAIFRAPGGDPGGILPTLDDPGVDVHIVDAGGDQTHEGAISRTQIIVFWNTTDRHPYAGSGGNADPCTSLYHELYHGYEDARGGQDHSPCVTAAGPSGLPTNEVNATRAQNQLRRHLGLPERSHYGNTPLPAGDCLPPDRQPRDRRCPGGGCADSNGDPHLVTLDGRRYDFMAVGEFVAVRDPSGGLEVQVRQEPLPGSRSVSVNTAVAARLGEDRVEVRLTGGDGGPAAMAALVDGHPRDVPPAGAVELAGGGRIERRRGASAEILTVTGDDGSTLTTSPIGRWGLHLTVQPATDRLGQVEGLFGDGNGEPADDLRPRGGEPLGDDRFDDLYPTFADSWRIDGGGSLFTYPDGRAVGSYDDRDFPEQAVRLEDLANREPAEAICRASGVTEPATLEACALDVALTGDAAFAAAHRSTQAWLGELRLDGPAVTARIDQPGSRAELAFEADAGTKVFLEATGSTLPSQCGVLRLVGPEGESVGGGCLLDGRGAVDGTVLAASGRHVLVVDPTDDAIGEVTVRLRVARDQRRAIDADGAAVQVRVGEPGAVARLTFDGRAGTRVFVDVTDSDLPSLCGGLRLTGPGGRILESGCLLDGRGTIDATTLEADGEHTIEVDPTEDHTGSATVRLTTVEDQAGALDVDGDEVVARIDEPGAAARFTLDGRAGDRIEVEARNGTLPSRCGLPVLRAPDGTSVIGGCVLDGEGGINAVELAVDGTYTLEVDPNERDTGEVTLRVRRA